MKTDDWKIQLRISGELIKWVVAEKLTVYEAAKKMGITQKKFSYLTRGLAYPSLTELMVIADMLGVTTDYLLCREGTPITK